MAGLAMDIPIDGVPTFDSNLNKNTTTTYLNTNMSNGHIRANQIIPVEYRGGQSLWRD